MKIGRISPLGLGLATALSGLAALAPAPHHMGRTRRPAGVKLVERLEASVACADDRAKRDRATDRRDDEKMEVLRGGPDSNPSIIRETPSETRRRLNEREDEQDASTLIGATRQVFEHFTCATRHLSAERALRIIEQSARAGRPMSAEAIFSIENLCDDAGPQFARAALDRDALDDEIPF